MKNPNISHMLKYHRKLNELSVQDVSYYLDNLGKPAAPKTIYGWESGQTQPNADTLMHLCKLYHIDDVLHTFGYTDKVDVPLYLSPKERSLIQAYREHTDMQKAVDKLLDMEE